MQLLTEMTPGSNAPNTNLARIADLHSSNPGVVEQTREAYLVNALISNPATRRELRRFIEVYLSNIAPPNKVTGAGSPADTANHALDMSLSLYTGTSTEQEVIQALKLYNKGNIAERIAYLYELASEDPSEDRIRIESLRNFARVMTNHPSLPDPAISVSPDGHAVAEWDQDFGILAMEFTAVSTVRYGALPRTEGYEHLRRISGERPASEIMEVTSAFWGS